MVKKDIEVFYWLQRTFDFLLPFSAVYFLLLFFSDTAVNRDAVFDLALLLGVVFVLVAQVLGLYRSTDLWYQEGFEALVFKSWLVTVLIQFFVVDRTEFDGLVYYAVLISIPFLIWFYRYLIYHFFRKSSLYSSNRRKVAILGAGNVGRLIAQKIRESMFFSADVVGFFDDSPDLIGNEFKRVPVKANLDNIAEKLNKLDCSEVFICLPVSSEARIRDLLNQLSDTPIVVKFVPNLFSFDLIHADWHDLFGLPIISVYDTPLNSLTNRFLKRFEDIVLAVIALVLSIPVMCLIALLIKFTSSGPVLFRQERYGLNGVPINVYKFRTMTVGNHDASVLQASKNDARITKFGGLLRRSSLDELPQFFNVLRGDMSIVGPRPHAAQHNEFYRGLVPKYMQRHMVKPGITGLAQINGFRGQTDTLEKMEKRVEFDLHYIRTWSIWLDLKIFILTLFKGFFHKNAY